MNTPGAHHEDSLLAYLPPLRRARGWRLYAEDGRRFLDLYCDRGRGILGAKAGGQAKLAKAMIDRGMVSGYPSLWEARLRKALKAWLPDFAEACFYSGESRLGDLGLPVREAFDDFLQPQRSSLAWARLPVPAAWSFGILLCETSTEAESLPPEDRIPPLCLAMAVRAISDLKDFSARYAEGHWSSFDPFVSRLFTRKGPWLIPSYGEEAHKDVFLAALSMGLLLSPDFRRPSLVPGEFDRGEAAPLGRILA